MLLEKLATWWKAKDIQIAASEVALRSRSEVWSRVNRQVYGMGIAEARGYTRVSARAIVLSEAHEFIKSYPKLGSWAKRHVVEIATELIIHHVWQLARRGKVVDRHRRRLAA